MGYLAELVLFYSPILLALAGLAAGAIGLLAWISSKLHLKPKSRVLAVSVANGTLLAGLIAWWTWFILHILSSLPMTFSDFMLYYRSSGGLAIIGGIVVGMLVCAGVILWKDSKRPRVMRPVGMCLIMTGWVLLAAVLATEFLLAIILIALVTTG